MNGQYLLFAAAALPLMVVVFYGHPGLAWCALLLAAILPLTFLGVDTRVAVALIAGVQVIRIVAGNGPSDAVPAQHQQVMHVFGALGLLFIMSAVWSQDLGRTLSAAAAWVVLIVALNSFARTLGTRKMLLYAEKFGFAMLACSAALVVSKANFAFVGGRAVGLLQNANGLGVLCALLLPAAVLRTKGLARVALLACIAVLIVMSASRAGALAATLSMAWIMFVSGSALRRIAALVAAVAGGWLLLATDWRPAPQESGLLRSNNSRSDLWAESLLPFRDNPFHGTGYGTQDGLGSSYIKVAAELGVIGILASALAMVTVIWISRRSVYGTAVIVAALVDAVFEGWLLTAGSFYCLLFIAILSSSAGAGSPKIGASQRSLAHAP